MPDDAQARDYVEKNFVREGGFYKTYDLPQSVQDTVAKIRPARATTDSPNDPV